MNRYWFLFLAVVLVMGCQPQTVAVTGTATATIPPLAGDPIPVELSALAANPTVYENAYVQLTGQYTLRPRLVCDSNPHPSPVTWGLSSGTLLALAGGFDEQLRPLLPQGLTMTVAGRWRHWLGNVGCGDAVQPQDLWYLQVTEVISPSPLTQVTLTPGSVPAAQFDETPVGASSAIAQFEPTDTAVTPLPPGSEPTEAGSINTTAIATVTTAVTPNDPRATPTPTGQIIRTTTVPGSTATPSATPDNSGSGTTTPSATPDPKTTATTSPTPTTSKLTTSTPSPYTENMGEAELEFPHMDFLDINESHLWIFDNELANNNLTIQVVPAAQADIIITVNGTNGSQLIQQDNAASGGMETIANLNLPSEGSYEIIITDKNEVGGDYAVVLLDDFSFYISFHQIKYGIPQTTSFNEDEEQVWFFDGNANDIITIMTDPVSGESDLGFEFMGPMGEPIDYVDDLYSSSDPEILEDYLLNNTGLYGIWLFNLNIGTANVEISVTK